MTKQNIFESITEKLIKVIEQSGDLSWVKQWTNNSYSNPFTGTKYRNTNYLNLLLDNAINNRSSGYYCTFKQASSNGYKVRKGAKSIQIVYYGSYQVENEDKIENKTVLRYSNVFNFDDLEGDKSDYQQDEKITEIDEISRFIDSIEHKSGIGSPCYIPSEDKILMPNKKDFTTIESYYSTYFHELSHWTSHKDRCDRPISTNFGSTKYAQEELIAELSAIFLSNEFNLTYDLENHASYLKSWLDSLKTDPSYLKTSLSLASKASNYLLSLK